MTTLAYVIGEIRRNVVKDTSATQKYSDYALTEFVNNTLLLLWPKCFERASDSTTLTSQTAGIVTYTNREYALPSGVPSNPGRMPIFMVEVGPNGGERISDSLQWTDRYSVLKGRAWEPAWDVDWARSKLVLRDEPSYDTAGTYRFRIRISYIKPCTTFTLPSSSSGTVDTTQTLSMPDKVIPVLLADAQRQAAIFREPSFVTDQELLQNAGQWSKQAADHVDGLVQRYAIRMTWPRVIR